jgi:GMP synthase (glutamine-hydrolysing)
MIAIFDFGSQYSRLIARRIREANVYCEIVPATTTTLAALQSRGCQGIIFSGSHHSIYDTDVLVCEPAIWQQGTIPILGICYGMQLLAHHLGGEVAPGHGRREYGLASVSICIPPSDPVAAIFEGFDIDGTFDVWMSHGDSVTMLPEGFQVIAASENNPIAAMSDGHGKVALQFHPEVTHTPRGVQILSNFLFNVCHCIPNWTTANVIEETVARIREQVGKERVICGLSGGVDSAVAALLIHRAIGAQLTCIFVDTGLLRKGESDQVIETFREHMDIPLIAVDASARFLNKLEGIEDPEEKRKRIGAEFIRVFESEAAKLGEVVFLAQGTLYPDVIESKSHDTAASQTIKTHHNVGGLPTDLSFKLVEPLRYLFKDEVRAIGAELGLPEDWVWRHPFPGPGLAIRIIGSVTEDRLALLREADAIFIDELRTAGLYRQIGQAFAVLTPVRSVGVMGDGRTYANVVALRAVTTGDFMTADWARLPYELLSKVANRIVNDIHGINRVVFDITSKPPATIEWE